MKSLATVIIPNLDSPLVDRTLEAIARQELVSHSLEVLVVGRDGPGLVSESDRVRLLETDTTLCAAAARNLGVTEARGEAILFTDADCRPAPDWAARLLDALERYPIAGGSVSFSLNGSRWSVADNIASFNALLRDRPAGPTSGELLGSLNLGLRREAWEQVGPFDEELITSEDFDWILRALEIGLGVFFDPRAAVEHADVRQSREALEQHAAWYGRHFNTFRRKHPGVFDRGPTWSSRRRLAAASRLKAWISALRIFSSHPLLLPGWRAFPGVVLFKRSWYRAVVDGWQEP